MTTFTLSENDYIKACFRLARTSLIIRFLIIILIFGVLILSDNTMSPMDYIGSVAVILAIATFLPYIFWKNRVKKLYQDEVALQLPTTFQITQEGYTLENDRGSSKTYWSDIKNKVETPDFYLLFTSKKFARIIPKKDLTIEDELSLTDHLSRLG